jgi:hypothetical protein
MAFCYLSFQSQVLEHKDCHKIFIETLILFPVTGCQKDDDCSTTEACIDGRCQSPCKCGLNAVCEVLYHKAICKCLPGYNGHPAAGCQGKDIIIMGTISHWRMIHGKQYVCWLIIYTSTFLSIPVTWSAHIKDLQPFKYFSELTFWLLVTALGLYDQYTSYFQKGSILYDGCIMC